jgi:hypothetical protein
MAQSVNRSAIHLVGQTVNELDCESVNVSCNPNSNEPQLQSEYMARCTTPVV